ncbi:lysophospholipid acyltransferase family protein [Salinibacillus xinjiangensis]|uniref:1-acyl-sn-glycerol-3-phosphate acyltransferase n=1 Tax=Salinibacillus xinjiangensis TaxID=1229268 RepID=A0A6G1X992_9BACI|nr:lysophospholipid acyltransferase family protein [Salinibacillus xinjiangensis]MRG87440.1 1-acylglycerol-3-phosphate O-acyltransferase [Salinibacillus xinjiangensis]
MRTIWTYLNAVIFVLLCVFPLQKVKKINRQSLTPEQLDEIIFKVPRKFGQKTLWYTGSKVDVVGNQNFPQGPVLIVANHQGNVDIPLLLGVLDKPFGFISKIEVKKIPIVRTWMKQMHCVFLDRNDKRQSVKAFRQGIDVLKSGHSLTIFPEGTRSQQDVPNTFKAGSFRLAKKAGVPVVPVAIHGTYKVMEANRGFIKPSHIKLTICEPISAKEVEELSLDELAKRSEGQIVEAIQQSKQSEE